MAGAFGAVILYCDGSCTNSIIIIQVVVSDLVIVGDYAVLMYTSTESGVSLPMMLRQQLSSY